MFGMRMRSENQSQGLVFFILNFVRFCEVDGTFGGVGWKGGEGSEVLDPKCEEIGIRHPPCGCE